jgi:hypothetical protein
VTTPCPAVASSCAREIPGEPPERTRISPDGSWYIRPLPLVAARTRGPAGCAGAAIAGGIPSAGAGAALAWASASRLAHSASCAFCSSARACTAAGAEPRHSACFWTSSAVTLRRPPATGGAATGALRARSAAAAAMSACVTLRRPPPGPATRKSGPRSAPEDVRAWYLPGLVSDEVLRGEGHYTSSKALLQAWAVSPAP